MLDWLEHLFFSDIGKKLKGFALFQTILGIILSIIFGTVSIVMAIDHKEQIYLSAGILIIFFGIIISILGSWLLYGFGELVDKTCDISKSVEPMKTYED